MKLYIVNTPYHLLLSVISGCLIEDSIIVMLDMNGNLNWYSNDNVNVFFNERFHYINLGDRGRFKRILDRNYFVSRKLNLGILGYIKNEVLKKEPSEIYVFNDSIAEVQGVVSSFPEAEINYIEDGSAPYNTHQVAYTLPNFIAKFLYGLYFDPVKVLGTSRYIDKCIFTYPELAREEHKKWPIERLVITATAKKSLCEFLKLFDFNHLEEETKGKDISLYLIPPVSDKKVIEKIKELSGKDNSLKLVKKHPLVQMNFKMAGKFIEVEPAIPAEALLLKFPTITAVYGYPSTTLFFSKYLFPNLPVYCVPSSLHIDGCIFSKNMEKCGITFL